MFYVSTCLLNYRNKILAIYRMKFNRLLLELEKENPNTTGFFVTFFLKDLINQFHVNTVQSPVLSYIVIVGYNSHTY